MGRKKKELPKIEGEEQVAKSTKKDKYGFGGPPSSKGTKTMPTEPKPP